MTATKSTSPKKITKTVVIERRIVEAVERHFDQGTGAGFKWSPYLASLAEADLKRRKGASA